MSTTSGTQKPLRIGVFYEEVQMSDLAGLDFFGNLTPKIIDVVAQLQPEVAPLKQFTIPIEFLYISSSTELAWCTPEMYVKPTHTYDNAPRDLDILLIGGPDLSAVKEESLTYLREASKQTKVILTTCIGSMWLARSGVLNGKKATTNRVMLGVANKMFPNVEWLDQRWVIEEGQFDGAQIWTAGGAACGKSCPLSSRITKRLKNHRH
jgi:putative intracellular protease/amidase